MTVARVDVLMTALAYLAQAGPVPVCYTVDETAVSEEVLAAIASIGLDFGGPDVSRCSGTVDYGRREAVLECSEGMAYRFEGYRGWVSEEGGPPATQRDGDIAWVPNVIWILDLLADPEGVVVEDGCVRVVAREDLLRRRPGLGRIGRRRRPPATDLTCVLDGEGRLRAVEGGYLIFRFSLELDYGGEGVDDAGAPAPAKARAPVEHSQRPDRAAARSSSDASHGRRPEETGEARAARAREAGENGQPGTVVATALDELAGAGSLHAEYAIDVAEVTREMRKLLTELGRPVVASLALRCSGSVDYGMREARFTCDDGTEYRFKRYRGWLRQPGHHLGTPSSGAIPWLPNVIWLLDLLADPEEVKADGRRLSVVARRELMRRRPGSGLRGQLLRPPGIDLFCTLDELSRVKSVTGTFETARFTLTLTTDEVQPVA